jgi:hypothetical protein
MAPRGFTPLLIQPWLHSTPVLTSSRRSCRTDRMSNLTLNDVEPPATTSLLSSAGSRAYSMSLVGGPERGVMAEVGATTIYAMPKPRTPSQLPQLVPVTPQVARPLMSRGPFPHPLQQAPPPPPPPPPAQPGEFAIQQEDFPALPGTTPAPPPPAPPKLGPGGGSVGGEDGSMSMSGGMKGLALAALGEDGKLTPSPSGGSSKAAAEQFGLLGLLNVIRMTDPDLNTLALGSDLTTLGLNLNASDSLYTTFASPWAEGPTTRDPKFFLPTCYTLQKPGGGCES